MTPLPPNPGSRTVPALAAVALLAVTLAASGCSIKRIAANGMANAIAGGGTVYSRDDDPDLVRDAIPFGLKTMESLLEVVPNHRGLLEAACEGFTQYAFAFVQGEADERDATDFAGAEELRDRARRLYVRGRDYGLRGLERDYRGITVGLQQDPATAVARLRAKDARRVFWVAASWGSAIAVGKDRPELVADLPAVRSLVERGVALDEGFDGGAFHEAMIVLEALPPAMGGSPDRARRHFERAIALSQGTRAGPYVTMAQTVSVMTQNRREFHDLLETALAIDPERDPDQRLVTVVLQRKARRLLALEDTLFLDDAADTDSTRQE